ncbi:LamG-like jellyroll fold domain-containing protein [Aquiluna sp. KACHI24]|uniref:LamG-like jellyroll fold domain-containing protein n=1 Tax=Aquiluna sp. KACHI24 TaxID=2968831 RepID=UPI0021FF07FB|nr:LamG-like jellyroll fold domain-containing protein [Aquiluna sp. KACHI24]BDQ00819.1 hypothetical protein AKACHI_11550 [Aquiluna sp. KACHI24]
MRELKLVRSATGWLRKLGLALGAVLASACLTLLALSGAKANQDLGWNSDVDFAANLSGTSNGTILGLSSAGNILQPTGTNPYSVQLWVNPGAGAQTAVEQILVNMEHKFAIQNVSGTWRYWVGTGTAWDVQVNTGVAVLPNRWTHVSLVMTATNTLFYVDGALVHSRGSRTDSGVNQANKYFAIGSWARGTTNQNWLFSGQVDEVKVWQSDRSSSVASDMHSRQAPSTGTGVYWDFNEGTGTTVFDRVGAVDLAATQIVYSDVKQVRALAGGGTAVTFPRTYLPGSGGWLVPQGVRQLQVLVIGAGGGGGPDNGSGGGGGEMRASVSQSVTPGGSVAVQVGQGGRAGSWLRPFNATTGESSSVLGAGMDYLAQGGTGGGGFGALSSPGGSGGRGGVGFSGGPGGQADDFCRPNTGRAATAGSDGPSSSIGADSARAFGGGGGGGTGYDTVNQGNSAWGSAGGAGGGGRGNNYKLNHDGSARNGASAGQEGAANTGGGGGGGSACNAFSTNSADNGIFQRTDGGSGGSGIIIFSYQPSNDNAWKKTGLAFNYAYTNSTAIIPTATNGTWTFEAWVKPEGLSSSTGWTGLFSQMDDTDSSTSRYSIWFDGLAFHLTSPNEAKTIDVSIRSGVWTHVAWAMPASGNSSLFIDGNLAWTGSLARTSAAGTYFTLGGTRQNTNQEFPGEIDQVKVWNGALSAAQVQASMYGYSTAGITSPTLRAHYDFNEFSSTALMDRSGNGNTLIYNQAVSGSYAETDLTSSGIVQTSVAHGSQTVLRFMRSYLTSAGGWTPPAVSTRYKALIVAGGGGGGDSAANTTGGGGGSGAIFYTDNLTLSSTVAIQVGMGGRGSCSTCVGGDGGDSTIGPLLVGGGGGGQGVSAASAANPGRGGSTYLVGGNGGGAKGDVARTSGAGGAYSASGIVFGGRTFLGYQGLSAPNSLGAGTGSLGSALPVQRRTFNLSGAQEVFSKQATFRSWTDVSNTDRPQTTGSGGATNYGYGTDSETRGGDGAAGVVILSYGDYLQVTRSPAVVRAGSMLKDSIRLQAFSAVGVTSSSTASVTVTASSNVLTLNGVLLTQSHSVTPVNGVYDFAGLGLSSAATGVVTLTFTSDAFVGTTLDLTVGFTPSAIDITSAGPTTGAFALGEFISSTSGTATIKASDLSTYLSASNTVVSTSGLISVQASVSGTIGSLTLLGNQVAFSNDAGIVLSSVSARILLKASDSINFNNGTSSIARSLIQTNNGDIILWSDADNSGVGKIYLGSYVVLNSANGRVTSGQSGGGRITIGGSYGNTGVDSGGHPLGAVAMNSTTEYALVFQSNSQIWSGGGDIAIRVKSNASYDAFHHNSSSIVNSGTGKIYLNAVSQNAQNGYRNQGGSWESAATVSPAIEIYTQTSATSNEAFEQTDTQNLTMVSTGQVDVGISISAITGATNTSGMLLTDVTNLLSAAGDINIFSNGYLNWATADARWIGSKSGSSVPTSSADINISTSALLDTTANASSLISTSGRVRVTPANVNFEADSTLNFDVFASSVEIGNYLAVNTSSKNFKIARDLNSVDPITVSAFAVTVDVGADLYASGANSPITLKARGWIDVVNNTTTNVQGTDASFSTIQTNNGDIIFWADSDANQQGLIWIAHNTRINSANGVYSYGPLTGGGDIIMAGGADDGSGRPAGQAWDTGQRSQSATNTDLAVGLGKFVDIFTGGGDWVVRASKKVAGGHSAFNFQSQGEFVTGVGQILVEAAVTGSGDVEAFEFFTDQETEAGALFSSQATSTPAISISARISGTGTQAVRIYTKNSSNPTTIQSLADAGGGVSITSNLGSTSTNTGTWLAAVNVLSKTGAVTFSSNAVVSFTNENFTQHWGERAGTSVSSSVAGINVIANGVIGNQRSAAFSTSGAVAVLPFGSNFGANINWWPLVNAGSFTLGVDSGYATAVHDIILYNSVTSNGALRVFGRSIDLDSGYDLMTTGVGSGVTLKAADFIEVTDGSSNTLETGISRLQTNRGDLTIWSDADSNGAGDVKIGWYAKLNTANGVEDKTAVSGGGDIFIAGGADSNLDGRPDGYARGRSGATWAIFLLPHLEIYSGGGDIVMRGRSNSSYGLLAYPVTEIFSGTGSIDLTGETTADGRGFAFIDYDLDTNFNDFITIVSHASSSPAVRISGVSAGATHEGLRLYGSGGSNLITVASAATTGGGVELIARQTGAGAYSMYLRRINLLSAAGDITVDGGGKITSLDLATSEKNRNFGSVAGNAYVPTSSANITFISDNFGFSADTSNYRLSGDVKFLPYTNNYFADLWGNGYQIFKQTLVGPRSLTIGKPPLAGDINRDLYIRNNQSLSGEIKIYAGNIIVGDGAEAGDLSAGSTVSLVARADLRLYEDITTQGGNIWIQSRANDAVEGGVLINSANFRSNGGDILISGGSSPLTSYAIGTSESTQYLGVSLDLGSTLNSGTGNITIRGSQGPDNDPDDGVGAYLSDAQISATSGNIRVYGRLADQPIGGAIDEEHSGILTYGAIITTTTGDIELIGDGRAVTGNKDEKRGVFLWPATITSTDGDITISGEVNSSAADSHDQQIWYSGANGSVIRSTNGAVSLLGKGSSRVWTATTTLQAGSELLIQDDTPQFDSTTWTGSARVTVQSSASAFVTVPTSLGQVTAHSGLSALTLGRSTETGTWTINKAFSINGPVLVHGGSIEIQQDLTSSSTSASITLKSRGNILTSASVDFSTQNGDVTFWSDTDNNGAGSIRFGASNTIQTRGGKLTIAGGLDDGGAGSGISGRSANDGYPDGYAVDTSNTQNRAGVELQTGRSFVTSGGDVFIAASGGGNAADRYGMFSAQGVTNAGSGRIAVWATLRPLTSGDYNYAWFAAYDTTNQWSYVQGGSDQWISSATNTDAITINVNSSNGSGQFSSALNAELPVASSGYAPGFRVAATGVGGEVNISAVGGTNNGVRNDGMGAPIHLQYSEILSRDGRITIESTLSATAPTHAGISLGDTAGDNSDATWNASDRVYLGASPVSNSPITTSSAQIVLRSNSIDFSDGVSDVRKVIVSTSGTLTLEPLTTSFRSELTTRGLDPRVGNLVIAKSGNSSTVTIHASHPVSISGTTTVFAGNFNQAGSVTSSAGVVVNSDDIAIGASLSSRDGSVTIRPQTLNRPIDLGTNASNRLGLVQSELSFIETPRLRFGSATTGDIFVTQNVSVAASQVTSVRLSTPGSVTSTGSILTAQNLAIDAGGGVNLPGSNSVSGAVAISASSMVTYSSAVSYSPLAVDGVSPVFGVGTAISQTNSPTTEEANEFLAVAFNPPPRFAITDTYSKVLDANNRLAYSYSVTATVASGSGTLTGLSTTTRVGGLISFSDLKVTTGVGVYAFTVSATVDNTTLQTRSVDYNVMAGEPGQLVVVANTASSVVGQTGLHFTVTVKDAYGNAITAGDHKNITVSASVSGTTATIVSGDKVKANDSGVATFNSLVIAASTSDTVTVSFAVTYTALTSETRTVTSSGTLITLTPGAPTQLAISSDAQTQANRSTLSQVVVRLLDAYGNQSLNRTGTISAVIGSGSGASLIGTTNSPVATGSNVAAVSTFSNLALRGTVGTFRLDFSYSSVGVASVSHTVTLTPGAATRLALDTAAAGARAGIAFTTQPRLSLRDADDNVVPGAASVSATMISPTLSGTTTVPIEAGFATYSDLAYANTATTRTLSYRVTAPAGLTALSTSQALTLTAGLPYQLVWATTAANKIAGEDQNPQRIDLKDEWGNLTSQSASVSIQVQRVSSTDSSQVLASSTVTISPQASSVSLSVETVRVTAVGSYKYKAVTAGLQEALSNTFVITNGATAKLRILQDMPSSVRSGMTFSPVVRLEALDAYNNPVLNKDLSISATVISGSAISLVGTSVAMVSGSSIIEFPDLAVEALASNLRLKFAVTTIYTNVSVSSQVFAVTFGEASRLTVSPTAISVANRATLNQLSVNVLDSAGNLVGDANTNVVASLTGASLNGTTSVYASSGIANFSSLSISGTVGGYTISFTATGLASATTSITLTHGVAAFVDLTVSATAKNAQNLATQPVVKILDADGNLVTSGEESDQTIELIVSPGTLTGTTAISASGGIATFSGVALQGTIGSHTLTGRIYLPSQLSDNETITLGFGDATKLTLETQGAGAASGIALTTQPILKLRDSSNNIVTGVAHNVVAALSPAASLSGTTVAVDTSTGIATFTALSISGTVGSYSISYSIEGASSSAVASVSQEIELTHGVATNLRVISQPTSGIAGATLSALVVEVIDSRGNRVTTGPTSSKSITITNAAEGAVFGTKSVSLSSGVATFDNLALEKANPNQRLNFTVTGFVSWFTTNFNVTAGSASELVISSGQPVNKKAGDNQSSVMYIRLEDGLGNIATAQSNITVIVQAVSSSDTAYVSKSVKTSTINAGGTFISLTGAELRIDKVGSYKIKATASGLDAALSDTFVISNAQASKLVVVQNVASSIRSKMTFSPAVRLQVQDQFNNPVVDSVTTVSTTIVSGSANAITGSTASNILGDSFIELPDLAVEGSAGTKRLRFSATSNSAGASITFVESQNFALTFGEPVRLSASATAVSVANRTTITDIVLSVLDSAGNTVTDSSAQIQATISGIALSGTETRYASSGQINFTGLSLAGSIGTYDLGFTSTGLTGATVSVTVAHGAADYLTLTKPAAAKNHISLGADAVVVKIFDADGNLVTSGGQSTQTVQLSSLGAVSSGTTAVSASAGVATFSNVVLTGLVGTKTLSATIQLPSQISVSGAIELEPGNPYRLELTQAADGFSNRVVFGTAPIVTVEDVSGNTVPTPGMDIRIKVATVSISGSVTASAQTGVATFASNLVLRGTAGSHTLIYEAEGTSSSGVISASQVITLNHGAASQLVVTTSVSDALSGVDFGTQPIVELRDPEGNRVSTSNQATATVEVSYSGAVWDAQTKQGVTLTGTRAISLSAGIGEFSALRLSGVAGSYNLDFSFTDQPSISISSAVTLEPGNATGISVVQGPQNVVAGELFAQSVSAEIIDDYYNRVTRVTASATLVANLKSATNSALISTSAEFTAQNGLVVFNGLTFESAGSRFIQFASGPGSSLPNLNASTSTTFVITHAAPNALQWTTLPAASVANDAVIAGQGSAYPQLKALDRFGNLVDTGTVSFVAEVTSTPAPQSFTGVSVDGVSGVGTFQNLMLRATVGNYTIRFKANTDTNANYFASISHTIEVLHGIPTQVVATTHPSAVRAGVNFATQPVIEIRDSAGNRVSSSNAVVTLTATGADLTGQTQSTAVNGIASFTSAQLSGSISGAVTLNYAITYQSQTISTSESVNLTPGLADYMVLDWTAADIQTRAAISPAPIVRLYDEFGNLVTLDNATQVTAKLYRLGSLVTTSNQVFTASAGVVDFTGLTFIATPNQGYSLQFESTGLSDVSSSAITVLPGPVDRVEIVEQPGTGAGVTQTRTGNALTNQPRVKLVDFDGNVVTTVNSGSVTAAIASGVDGQVTTASVSVSAGIAQFTDLGLIGKVATPTQSAEIYRLEFSYNGITSSPSAQLTLKHNVAHKIVQIQDAVGGPAGLDFLTQPKVKVVDGFGNTVFDDARITILAVPEVASGTGGVSVAGNNEAQTDASGVATFDMGLAGSTGNTYKLVFKDDQEALIPASQSGIVITYGQARQLFISRAASATDSNSVRSMTGEALKVQPVIEVHDDWGNRVLNSNHTITVSLSSTVRGARDYLKGYTVSAVAGVATFSNLAMIVLPETSYQLTYKFTGNSTALTQPTAVWVTHALAEYITIERQPQGGNKTGNSLSLSPVVTVRDFDGNPTTTITGQTISATITQGAGSIAANGQASLVGGVATFSNLTIVALPGENQRLTFTLDGYQNSASQAVTSVASNEISVTFNDPHQLAVIQQPSANAVTAELLGTQPKVVVQDQYGNTVSDFVGSVWVEAQNGSRLVDGSDNTIPSISAQVSGGVATFVSLRIEGEANQHYSLTFNSGALTSTTSNPVTLTHTSAYSLRIVTQPVGAITGQLLANQPSVEILDRFGNVTDTDNASQVSVSVFSGPNRPGGSAAQISGSTTVTVQNGLATFSGLKFTGLVNADYVFRFASGAITTNSNVVRVTSAGADSFVWVQLPQVDKTGELMPTPAVLKVLDFDGNLAVSSSDSVTVTVTGGGYIESGTTSQIVNGYVTFSSLILVAPPSVSQQLTFTATTGQGSFSINTPYNLQVRHTDASELRVNRSPNQVGQQGAAFTTQPRIYLYDRYGNKAIYDNSTVVTATIASGSGGAVSGSASVTANAGEANFSSLALTGSPGVAYTLKYSVGSSYEVVDSTALRLFKTAAIQVSYPTVNFSLSATVAPTVAVTDSTENPLVFTSTTTQYCTVNGSTGVATIVEAGTCVIRVSVADGTYYKQNVLDVNLVILKATQTTLLMTSPNFVDYGQVLTLTHSGGSSTATPEYFASGTCRAFGNQLMMFGDATEDTTASCTVRVIQDGDQNFEPALSAGQRITVRKIAQAALTIGNSRETSVGDLELFTIGGSGPGTVSYQVSSGVGTATCSIVDGNKLRATTNGWCEVGAQKNASTNYNTASSPVAIFTFSKQVQVVTFTSAVPGMLLPGQSYQLAASASSGLSVSFAITRGLEVQASAQTSYSPAICSLSQSTVTMLGTGTCEITATQAGNAQFAAATAKLILTVGQLNQVISFPQPDDMVYGTPTSRLTAQASSGLPVRYTVSAGVTACTVTTDGLLTLTSAGDCSVVASQPGDGRYAAAAPVTRFFKVTPDQASSPALLSAAVGNQWFTVGFTQPSYTGGSSIIGYRLEVTDVASGDRYVNSACSTSAPLSCTMVGIPNGRNYTARVAAITAAGIGRYSSATAALTPTNAEISVTQLQAGISGANLVMEWTPPAAVSGNFLRYDVYVWPQGSTPPQTPTQAVTTQSATTTAVDVTSMSSSGTISQIVNQVQPVFVNAFQVRSRVVVFGAVNQGPMGFIRLASSQSQVATASNLVGYEIRVVTVTDEHSTSQTINTAMGVKLGLSTPEAPTQLTLDTTDPTKIIASWGAPNFDGGFPIDDYEVRANGQVICANIQIRMCEISPLTDSTLYRIEVRARSAAGFGAIASAQHTTPTPPAVSLNSGTELLVRLPAMQNFIPKLVRPGQVVEVGGTKLNAINELRLGGVKVDFTAVSATELRFRVPLGTQPGTYNIEHFSEFGKVTVIDAITVITGSLTESPITESPSTDSPDTDQTESPETGNTESPEVPNDGNGSSDNGSSNGGSDSSDSGNNRPEDSGNDSGSGSDNPGGDSADGDGSEPEVEPGDETQSEVALPAGRAEPTLMLWWLLIALLIAGASLWLLSRNRGDRP